jgi:hypothetical protein
MTRDRELMDRLAGANPVPAEHLEEADRREADAIFERIVATSPAPPQRPRRGIRPRVAVAGAVGACLAAAVVVVADLIDSDRSGDGIAARAAAAVSDPDAVYHVVSRFAVSGAGVHDRAWTEQWLAPHRSRSLEYALHGGRRGKFLGEMSFNGDRIFWYDAETGLVADEVHPRSGTRGPRPPKNGPPGVDPFGDPAAQLRKFVKQGRLHSAGRTRVRGKPAYRLVSDVTSDRKSGVRAERVTYLVDARTYFPLELRDRSVQSRPSSGVLTARIDYLVYEKLRATPANLRKLRFGRYPGAHH